MPRRSFLHIWSARPAALTRLLHASHVIAAFSLTAIVAVSATLSSPRGARGAERGANPRPSLFCFYADDGGRGLARLQVTIGRIAVLAPEWYRMDLPSGVIHGSSETAPLQIARRADVPVWPVMNARVGPTAALANPAKRARLVDSLARLARSQKYDGLTLDFEGMTLEQGAVFSTFVATLAAALHNDGRRLAVYVVRRTATAASSRAQAYDWAALAASADLVLASSYSEHWETPGPLVTAKGFATFLTYVRAISRTKIAPILGAFGYSWTKGTSAPAPIAASDAAAQGALVGEKTADGGNVATYAWGDHVVWYPTTRGLVAEAEGVRDAGVSWLALFSLGREKPQFWLRYR